MNLAIKSVLDGGDVNKERIVLQALDDENVGEYAIFRAANNEDHVVTTDVSHVFWFPDKVVSAGDHVVVYTKRGTDKEKLLNSGSRSHFFYWGLSESLWRSDQYAVVALHVDSWVSHLPSSRLGRRR